MPRRFEQGAEGAAGTATTPVAGQAGHSPRYGQAGHCRSPQQMTERNGHFPPSRLVPSWQESSHHSNVVRLRLQLTLTHEMTPPPPSSCALAPSSPPVQGRKKGEAGFGSATTELRTVQKGKQGMVEGILRLRGLVPSPCSTPSFFLFMKAKILFAHVLSSISPIVGKKGSLDVHLLIYACAYFD